MRKLSTPKPLATWLTQPRGQLHYYYDKAQQLIKFNAYWKQQTDIPLVLHSIVANFEHTTLTLAVESSSWATYLHYSQQEVRARLQTWPGLEKLKTIKWYVQSPTDS